MYKDTLSLSRRLAAPLSPLLQKGESKGGGNPAMSLSKGESEGGNVDF